MKCLLIGPKNLWHVFRSEEKNHVFWIASRRKVVAPFVSYRWESRQFSKYIFIGFHGAVSDRRLQKLFIPFGGQGEKGDTVIFEKTSASVFDARRSSTQEVSRLCIVKTSGASSLWVLPSSAEMDSQNPSTDRAKNSKSTSHLHDGLGGSIFQSFWDQLLPRCRPSVKVALGFNHGANELGVLHNVHFAKLLTVCNTQYPRAWGWLQPPYSRCASVSSLPSVVSSMSRSDDWVM